MSVGDSAVGFLRRRTREWSKPLSIIVAVIGPMHAPQDNRLNRHCNALLACIRSGVADDDAKVRLKATDNEWLGAVNKTNRDRKRQVFRLGLRPKVLLDSILLRPRARG